MNSFKKLILLMIFILVSGCSSSPKVPEKNIPEKKEIVQQTQEDEVKEIAMPESLIDSLKDFYNTGFKAQNNRSEDDKSKYIELSMKINKMITEGADVNKKDLIGNSPLSIAVKYKDSSMMEKLLKKGANPNVTTTEGYVVLISSLENEDIEGSLLLIKYGATINGDNSDSSPLTICAVRSLGNGSFIDVARALLEKNANPNVTMKSGQPILLFTIKTKNSKFSKLLIDKGATLDYMDEDNITTLNWAILLKENQTGKLMIKKESDVLNNENAISPLAWSSLVKNENMYKYLKDRYLEVKENEKGWASLRLEETLDRKTLEKLLGKNSDEMTLPIPAINPIKKAVSKVPLKKMGFLSVDYNDEFLKIYTEDEIKKEMFLKRPARIVFDFNRLSGVKNFTKSFNDNHFKKIAVGRHSGWYRVVLYMKNGIKYNSVIEKDGIKIIYK